MANTPLSKINYKSDPGSISGTYLGGSKSDLSNAVDSASDGDYGTAAGQAIRGLTSYGVGAGALALETANKLGKSTVGSFLGGLGVTGPDPGSTQTMPSGSQASQIASKAAGAASAPSQDSFDYAQQPMGNVTADDYFASKRANGQVQRGSDVYNAARSGIDNAFLKGYGNPDPNPNGTGNSQFDTINANLAYSRNMELGQQRMDQDKAIAELERQQQVLANGGYRRKAADLAAQIAGLKFQAAGTTGLSAYTDMKNRALAESQRQLVNAQAEKVNPAYQGLLQQRETESLALGDNPTEQQRLAYRMDQASQGRKIDVETKTATGDSTKYSGEVGAFQKLGINPQGQSGASTPAAQAKTLGDINGIIRQFKLSGDKSVQARSALAEQINKMAAAHQADPKFTKQLEDLLKTIG